MTDVVTGTGRLVANRYELIAEIGRGGMATVYRARDRHHDRDVAVKILDASLCEAITAARFLREIQIEARLQHPHIIGLFDAGEVDGCPFYAMPFVDGESLRDRLRREKQLSVPDTLKIAREVASALSYAHSQGVVHRDVKPANILLSSGVAMLVDFGIARAAVDVGGEELTDRGLAIGTVAYMSPEQASGQSSVDARSDIYALGCVVYEMLAGEPPFTGRTGEAIRARHILERIPSLEVVRPGLPASIVSAVERSLAKTPVDRFATTDEFIAALEGTSPSRRRRWLPITIASILVLVFTVAGIVIWSRPSALDRAKVVVFPLEEGGLPPTETGAGGDVALMIAAALEHADPLRPLDIRDRLTPEQRANPAILTAAQRREIARGRGAGLYITGVIRAFPDSMVVILTLNDVTGDSVIASRKASGPRDGAPLHHLGIDATKRLIPSLIDPGREIDLTPLRDRDPGAIALFVQGEREYRLANFSGALTLYERALAVDSSLALAAVKGAQAATWNKDSERAANLLGVALARESLLPTRYIYYARGSDAYLHGRADSAIAALERAIRAAPGWAEALMALGEVHYHLVPLRPNLDSIAARAFNAALASDSGFSPPVFHLAEIAIRDGDLVRARALVDRFESSKPTAALMIHLKLMLDCTERGARSFDWSAARDFAPKEALSAGKALTGGGRALACADGAFRSLLTSDSTQYHWGAIMGHHAILAATGQRAQLVAFVDSTVARGSLRQAMMAYIVDSIAGLQVGEQARNVQSYGTTRWGERYEGLRARASLNWLEWLFGTWHAQIGDTTTTVAFQASLDSAARAGGSAADRLYADALRAHLTLARRDTSAAIEQFRALSPAVVVDDLEWDWGMSLAIERFRLAEVLLARQRYREAQDVASVFDHQGPIAYLVFLPPSLVLRYRAAMQLGDRDAAMQYRTRLVELGRSDLVATLR